MRAAPSASWSHTHTYRKQIDMQAGCQAGRAFPLEEGVTGAVARAGRPVTFRHYADVPGGHVSADSPLYNRAVIGVPIRLRSDLLGSLVVFAPDDEYCFGDADAQLLQRFATHAAIAMANARLHAEAADRAKAAAVWAERERSMLDVHDALGRGLATVLLELAHAEELAGGGWPAKPNPEDDPGRGARGAASAHCGRPDCGYTCSHDR